MSILTKKSSKKIGTNLTHWMVKSFSLVVKSIGIWSVVFSKTSVSQTEKFQTCILDAY